MFDKTFFRFALGFAAIVILGMGSLYIAGYFDSKPGDSQAAAVR